MAEAVSVVLQHVAFRHRPCLPCSVKIKQSGLQGDEAGVISSVYGADFPIRLGRVDASQPDPSGRVPKPDAPVQDIQVGPLELLHWDWLGNPVGIEGDTYQMSLLPHLARPETPETGSWPATFGLGLCRSMH